MTEPTSKSPREKAQTRADNLAERFKAYAADLQAEEIRPYIQYNSLGTASSFGFTLDDMALMLDLIERNVP